jgi:hypothetical protein
MSGAAFSWRLPSRGSSFPALRLVALAGCQPARRLGATTRQHSAGLGCVACSVFYSGTDAPTVRVRWGLSSRNQVQNPRFPLGTRHSIAKVFTDGRVSRQRQRRGRKKRIVSLKCQVNWSNKDIRIQVLIRSGGSFEYLCQVREICLGSFCFCFYSLWWRRSRGKQRAWDCLTYFGTPPIQCKYLVARQTCLSVSVET